NKLAAPRDKRFTKRFLVITPGLTIRDRLRVLLPGDPDNYYRLRDLVPAELHGGLGQAQIVITNYHTFLPREVGPTRGASATTKDVLTARVGGRGSLLETEAQVLRRVLRDLGGGTQEVVVLNDEAHHCYRGRDNGEQLTGSERAEAKSRNEEARVWFRGVCAVAHQVGVKSVYDLSATPFFLAGSGYREGTLFPWVVSDFSLIDAIESGIVKVPRMPVDDDRVASTVTYRDLWDQVRDELPTGTRKALQPEGEPVIPQALETALHSLYGAYRRQFESWQRSAGAEPADTPPVFIVVCNNTAVSKLVFDWIAGHPHPELPDLAVGGRLELFSNVDADGRWRHRPRTILVDSQQLESGEAMSADFRRIAAIEIQEFKDDYARRFPGRSMDEVTDEDLLREVMNTVGKHGKLGEGVRCVVSVSMLTEGWDANTVTHILGVRAFGTQLLCEQVVGRGLRRRSYAVDDNGFFTPEYADVLGVPFRFIPTVAQTRDVTMRPTRAVHAEPDRAHAEIMFPRLTGYRIELPDERLYADFRPDTVLALSTADFPTRTELIGVVGEAETLTLDELRAARDQQVAYELAKMLVQHHLAVSGQRRPWLFPQVVRLVRQWMAECIDYHDDAFPGLLLVAQQAHRAAEKIMHAITWQDGDRVGRIVPVFRQFEPVGSTAAVDFVTLKEVMGTSPERCHVNFVTLDGAANSWERAVAKALDSALPGVAAYVKNDHLGFGIPYVHQGISRLYLPDFLVQLADTGDGVTRTLIVEVSGGRKSPGPTAEKAVTARESWVPAVNSHGGYGLWSYCEIGRVSEITKAKQVLTEAIDALAARLPVPRRAA
ncbi:MAG: BPTD_3080 family restriction endonuclease, partial [Pseudonocardiaceae bacterium]